MFLINGRIGKLRLLIGLIFSGTGGVCGKACKAGKRACLNNAIEVIACGQNMPPTMVTLKTWPELIKIVRKKAKKNVPIWKCVREYYNLCTIPLVTGLSRQLWHLYSHIDGTNNETYESYGKLPAFWVHACEVIEDELDKLRKDSSG